MRTVRALGALTCGALALAAATPASAHWSGSGLGTGTAVSDSMPAGATPTPTLDGRTVSVGFTRAHLPLSERALTRYRIARYSTGSATANETFLCTWPVGDALSCDDPTVPHGSVVYTVTPLLGTTPSWTGEESPQSASVAVVVGTPSFTSWTHPVNSAAVGSVSAAGTAPADTTVTLVIGDAGSGSITRTATVGAGGTWSVSGVDVSALADGTLTYTAYATDDVGNESASASVTATKKTTAVAAPTFTSRTNPITGGNKDAVAASGTAAGAASVTLVVTDSGSGSITRTVAVTSGSWSATGIDTSAFADGTVTFTATAKDSVGNTSPATSVTSTKSTTIANPTIASWTNPVTAGNKAAVTASGTAPGGSTVTLVVSDSASGKVTRTATATSGGAWSVTGIDTTALLDGTITFTASAADAVGNTSGTVSVTATKKATLPTPPTISSRTTPINLANRAAVAASGTAQAGTTITVEISGTSGPKVTATAVTTSGGTWSVSGMNASTLPDGAITYSAKATDAVGNVSTVTTATATKDTVAPNAFNPAPNAYMDAKAPAADAIRGTAENGTTVTITEVLGPNLNQQWTGAGTGAQQTYMVDNVAGPNTPVKYSVVVTDAAGNPSAAVTISDIATK